MSVFKCFARVIAKVTCCALSCVVCLPAIGVADTTLAPDIHISSDYDNNKRLQLDNKDAVNGYVAEAALTLKSKAPQWKKELYTQLKSRKYEGGYELDSDDQNVSASLGFDGQTTSTTLKVTGINDTTLTDQLDFSGYTEVLKRRHYRALGFSHLAKLTPLDTVSLDYSTSDSRYVNADTTSLVNYRYDSVATTLQHAVDETIAGYATASGSHYEAKDIANESNSLDLSLGTLWKPSAPTQIKLGLGHRKTDYEYIGGLLTLDDRFSYVTLEASRQLMAGLITFKTQNLSQPTGDGNLYNVRKLSLDYVTEITLRHKLSITAAYSEQRASADDYAINDRNNIQLIAAYRYRMTRDVGLQTLWTYRQQEFLSLQDDADSNAIWLGVYWAPVAYKW